MRTRLFLKSEEGYSTKRCKKYAHGCKECGRKSKRNRRAYDALYYKEHGGCHDVMQWVRTFPDLFGDDEDFDEDYGAVLYYGDNEEAM